MEVAPTTLDLVPGDAGLFYLTNRGDVPVTVQVEALDWSQPDGNDKLVPSKTLIVSPPFVTLTPNQRQTVRLLSTENAGGVEITHRLRVSQIPDASPQAGVHILLQISIPVFVGVKHNDAPPLTWEGAMQGGALVLTVHNSGAYTAKLESIAVEGDASAKPPVGPLYVLPGATRTVLMQGGSAHVPDSPLHITATDTRSGEAVAADLTLHR
jgi:fimbrial chaperone protein